MQPPTLDKIIEWRDEKDEPDAVEDILREVIVISDDEDEERGDEAFIQREDSVEIVSSQEIADTVHVRPIDYSTLDDRSRHDRPLSPENDWAPSVKFIRRLSTPPVETGLRRQNRSDRQQAHRNRVWHEAVSRRRNATHPTRDIVPTPALRQEDGEGHHSFSEAIMSQRLRVVYSTNIVQSLLRLGMLNRLVDSVTLRLSSMRDRGIMRWTK